MYRPDVASVLGRAERVAQPSGDVVREGLPWVSGSLLGRRKRESDTHPDARAGDQHSLHCSRRAGRASYISSR